MIFFLDTTERDHVVLALISEKSVKKAVFKPSGRLSESLPSKINAFLKKNKLNLSRLTGLAVVRGPGSFVGIRTGVAYANALAKLLNIGLLGLKKEESANLSGLWALKFKKKLVTPAYGAPPNITKAKK